MNNETPQTLLLNIAQVSKSLGLSRTKIYALIATEGSRYSLWSSGSDISHLVRAMATATGTEPLGIAKDNWNRTTMLVTAL